MGRKGESAEASGDLARLRVRQHGHCGLAPGLLIVLLGRGHHQAFTVELAELKLSMILDNLIMKGHDCFVTKP